MSQLVFTTACVSFLQQHASGCFTTARVRLTCIFLRVLRRGVSREKSSISHRSFHFEHLYSMCEGEREKDRKEGRVERRAQVLRRGASSEKS